VKAFRDPPLAAALLDALFPCACLGCGRRLPGDAPPLLLCVRCRGRLRPLPASACCRTCARPLPGAGRLEVCAGCRDAPPPFDRLHAAWRYEPPLDRVVHALKFARLDFLAADLARLALDRGTLGADGPWDVVVPVPLAAWRRLVRGFNQAERLAAAVAARLGLPCREALTRRGAAPTPQARLGGRERRERMRGSLSLRLPAAVRGRRVLVVDDVLTTGATLAAAAAALRSGGAAAVTAFAVAVAAPPERAGSP
jgi:ComF family protein